MAMASGNNRRYLALPDEIWETIDAEAGEVHEKWYTVVQARLEESFEHEHEAPPEFGLIKERLDSIDSRLITLSAQVQAMATVLAEWIEKQSPAEQVPVGPESEDEFAVYAPYQDEMRAMAENQKVIDAKRAQDAEVMRLKLRPWPVKLWEWLWRV